MEDGEQVLVGGMISSIKLATAKKTSRNGHTRFANFDLEDSTGIVRCIAWPGDYARYEGLITPENIILVAGKVDRRGREPNLIVNRLLTMDQAAKEFTTQIAIKFERGLHTLNDVERVRGILSRFPGATDVVVLVDSARSEDEPTITTTSTADSRIGHNRLRYIMTTGTDCRVNIGREFLQELTDAIGDNHFELKAAKPRRARSGSQGR